MQANSQSARASTSEASKVFVVHGRSETLWRAIFDFLRTIGLKPIEWTQAVSWTGKATPFVGEVLDAAFQRAQAVVVRFTGDDEARLKSELQRKEDPDYEKLLSPQARPNVLFEAGLALGRYPDRTVLVEVGPLRPFSDIAGRHTIRLDNSPAKRQNLARRLQGAGCPVDLTGTDWHSVGDFEVPKEISADVAPTEGQLIMSPDADTIHAIPIPDEETLEEIASETGLHTDEIKVLIGVAHFAPHPVGERELLQNTGLHNARTIHFLYKLERQKHVGSYQEDEYSEPVYFLEADGRAVLVKYDLV